MNHLAHFHLAWPEEDLVVGALEGDFHRGALPGDLRPELVDGVALHRAIDGFTDRHPVLARARARFPSSARRYAGIMLDLCFDYFLSRHWQRFCHIDRELFTREIYTILRRGSSTLSAPALRTAAWLEQHDILGQFNRWEAVPAAGARVGQRLRRANPLHQSEAILQPLLPELEQAFLAFYPELVRFCHNSAKLATLQARTC
jgi:acyl carrier protein phosphodiesterase